MNRKAFTLIELLVVIAIIAILAAILFPVFAQAKQAAKKTNDLSQIKQLATANIMYLNDSDDMFMAIPWAPGSADLGPHWADRLQPYTKNKNIFSDSSNSKSLYNAGGYWWPGSSEKNDPDKQKKAYRVTYTFNHLISQSDDDYTKPLSATSQSAIDTVADTVLMGPSQNWFSWSTCRLNGSTADLFWNVSAPATGSWEWGYEFWGGIEGGGYTGGANFSFADGHAAYSKLIKSNDAKDGVGPNNLYMATFAKAKTEPSARTDGACPSGYDSASSGF